MGMFDSVICDYTLPWPDDMGEARKEDFGRFQTKDLGNMLDDYRIGGDGAFWIRGREWDDGRKEMIEKDWTPCRINAVFGFYDSIYKDSYENDYFITFEAAIHDGSLKCVRLVSFEKECNAERKEGKRLYMEKDRRRRELLSRWYMRWYPGYCRALRFVFRNWQRVLDKIPSAARVEYWLRPF